MLPIRDRAGVLLIIVDEVYIHSSQDPFLVSAPGIDQFGLISRMRENLGIKVVKALKRNDDGVTHAAIDMLNALMQVGQRSRG